MIRGNPLLYAKENLKAKQNRNPNFYLVSSCVFWFYNFRNPKRGCCHCVTGGFGVVWSEGVQCGFDAAPNLTISQWHPRFHSSGATQQQGEMTSAGWKGYCMKWWNRTYKIFQIELRSQKRTRGPSGSSAPFFLHQNVCPEDFCFQVSLLPFADGLGLSSVHSFRCFALGWWLFHLRPGAQDKWDELQGSANSRDVEWLHGISGAPWTLDLVVEVWSHSGQPESQQRKDRYDLQK